MRRRARGVSPGPPPPRTAAAAYLKAVTRLAHRDRSEHEIRSGLLRDGFSAEIAEETVQRLRGERALDDAGYAARFARTRLRFGGLGQNRVRQELRIKGVGRGTAEAGLREALTDVPEADTVETLARRYWKAHTADEPKKRLRKLWAFLLRRGFPGGLVQERLRGLWPGWRDALDGLEPVEDETAAYAVREEE